MQFTGELLHGTYRLERLIGEGGMGAVYEATHVRLARRFAVKVLREKKTSTGSTSVARFRREAQVTSTLGSPHIVDVVDFNITDQGVPYIVMELLEGEDLQQRLDRVGRIQLPELIRIFEPIVAALQTAHSKGIVHRDLKPSNIFLSRLEDGQELVKVVDFGISKITGDRPTSITDENTLIGTPHFMAPEQARGEAVDHRTDIFAVGAMIYLATTGYLPYRGAKPMAVIYQIVHEEPPPLRSYLASLPAELEAVVARAMSKAPADRFPGIRAFWNELVSAADGSGRRPSTPHLRLAELEVRDKADALGPTCPRVSTTKQRSMLRPSVLSVALAGLVVVGAVVLAFLMAAGDGPRDKRDSPRVAGASVDARTQDTVHRAKPAPTTAPTTTEAVGRTGRPTRGLWLRSEPAGAEVRVVGGARLGHTPLHGVVIDSDEVKLLLSSDGFRTRQISVGPGTTPVRLKEFVLEPLGPAVLQVTATVNGQPVPARIFLDEGDAGEAPVVLKSVTPGRHILEARLDGRSVRRTVLLRPAKLHLIALELPR